MAEIDEKEALKQQYIDTMREILELKFKKRDIEQALIEKCPYKVGEKYLLEVEIKYSAATEQVYGYVDSHGVFEPIRLDKVTTKDISVHVYFLKANKDGSKGKHRQSGIKRIISKV